MRKWAWYALKTSEISYPKCIDILPVFFLFVILCFEKHLATDLLPQFLPLQIDIETFSSSSYSDHFNIFVAKILHEDALFAQFR